MTYDPTEVQEGELSEEEQDSLAVGEKLEEQSQELLAGKFKDAEALESAYVELQKKLGSKEEEAPEPEAKTKSILYDLIVSTESISATPVLNDSSENLNNEQSIS